MHHAVNAQVMAFEACKYEKLCKVGGRTVALQYTCRGPSQLSGMHHRQCNRKESCVCASQRREVSACACAAAMLTLLLQAIRIMREQTAGGHIFNMDGAGADGGATPRFAAYGATKRSLAQLSKSLQVILKIP